MTIPPVSTMGNPVSYITLAELKRNPIYNQLEQLVVDSSPADRDAELTRIIARVSALINGFCNQNLAATVDNEITQIRASDDGSLRINTRSNPIVEVLSVSVGPNVYSLTEVPDLSHVILDPWRITIPSASPSGSWYWSGNLPLGGVARPGQRLWAEFTYVNGFPITTIAAGVSPGDTSITVVDATGVIAGRTLLTIEDGIYLEQVVPTAVNGNVLTVPAVAFAHQAGVGIHSFPGDIKEAVLVLMSRLHDTWSLSMGAITRDGSGAKNSTAHPVIMCQAGWMLNPYVRAW